jgi:hypothetical protein
MILKNVSIALLLLTTVLTSAFLVIPTHAAAPPMTLKIDGNLNDAAWKHGRAIDAFQTLDGKNPKAATTGAIYTDAHYLYLAFRCEEPQMDKLQNSQKQRDGNLWSNDCIEIVIAPFADSHQFFHLIVDVNNQVYDALNCDGKEDNNYDLSITAKTQKQQNGWTLEMAIPLSELELNQARQALMNFGRERKPESELTSWHGAFAKPDTWQQVKLTLNQNHIADVQKWNFGDAAPQYGDNAANINFVSGSDVPVKVLLWIQENGKWAVKNSQLVQAKKDAIMRVSASYSLLPCDKAGAVRWVLEAGNEHVFQATRQIHLPPDAMVITPQSPYYYTDEKYAYFKIRPFLSPAGLKNGSLLLTVKSPDGKVWRRKKISSLRPSLNVALDISGWDQGDGVAFAELAMDGKVMAHQRIVLSKRPGPYGKHGS